LFLIHIERVWQCGCGCFSNSFSCRNACQWFFFYFLKIIFDISTSKRSKKYKSHSILIKKKIQICTKRRYKHSTKRSHNALRDPITTTKQTRHNTKMPRILQVTKFRFCWQWVLISSHNIVICDFISNLRGVFFLILNRWNRTGPCHSTKLPSATWTTLASTIYIYIYIYICKKNGFTYTLSVNQKYIFRDAFAFENNVFNTKRNSWKISYF